MSNPNREPWKSLAEELAELERTNPDVRHAAKNLERVKREIVGRWWVRVTDWNGREVYDGPAPAPTELITIAPEDAAAGRCYTFDMTPGLPGTEDAK